MKLVDKYTIENLTIWSYEENGKTLEIRKNHNIMDKTKCHICNESENGEGCRTIFYTLKAARKEVKRLFSTGEKIKTGRDFGLCEQCQCHYSYGTKEYRKSKSFACHKQKEQYSDSVENSK